uniref:Gustatory receptor n=1 Tax=Tetranychus urticae TaxID=32264 RepID=T1JY49_TETUR
MNNNIDVSSIFMIIINKKGKKVHYVLLAVILLLTASIGSIIMFNAYVNILTAKTLREKIFCVLQFLIGISIIIDYFFLVFVSDWKRFVEFIQIWTKTGLQDDEEIINYIKRERKKYRVIIFALDILFTTTVSLFSPQYGQRLHQISVCHFATVICISFTYSLLFSLVSDFPLQFALIICTVFIRVNQRLEHLIEHPDSVDDNIRSIRFMHSVGSQLALKADQFVRYFTAANYSIMVSFILINLYSIIFLSESLNDYFAGTGVQVVVTSVAAMFTYYAIKINHLASKGFHHAYQLTFIANSPNHFAETSLLVYRMGRNDIGLTFANLFTITASFVTSLVTLCITFILAFPTIQC